jgi:hypothetical protein
MHQGSGSSHVRKQACNCRQLHSTSHAVSRCGRSSPGRNVVATASAARCSALVADGCIWRGTSGPSRVSEKTTGHCMNISCKVCFPFGGNRPLPLTMRLRWRSGLRRVVSGGRALEQGNRIHRNKSKHPPPGFLCLVARSSFASAWSCILAAA